MYREDIEEDLNDHYSKITLSILAEYLGIKQSGKESKIDLISKIVETFTNKKHFDILWNKLTPWSRNAVNHLVWNGISDFKTIDSIYNSKLCLEDYCLNSDDPFLSKFKSPYVKEIQFSIGLRSLFKQHLTKEKISLESQEFSSGTIFKSNDYLVVNLDAVLDFINANQIDSRPINKRPLVKNIKDFKKGFNGIELPEDSGYGYLFKVLQFSPVNGNSLERVKELFQKYKKGDLVEGINIDHHLFYPYIKYGGSESTIELFLKRGRYSILNRVQKLEGWISVDGFVRELSLGEETQIFDSSFFGSLMSVKVPDEFRREFSNKIELTYKRDNEDFLISPMCRGIIYLLHIFGGADICFDHEKIKYGLTTLEKIISFRITPLGKYLLGESKSYTISENDSNYIVNDKRLLITTTGEDSRIKNFLRRIADEITDNAFLIDYQSFFKDCGDYDGFIYNKDRLIELLGDSIYPIWSEFISRLEQRVNPIYNEQELLVVNFPREDEEFIELITEDPKLRDLYFMVEGVRGAFTSKNYELFRKYIGQLGYII